eukprot:Hpha_TRINITY_DN2352_c0_g1::TRINITY_DN2352_c0_g1_i1::g.351::m.351
MSLLLFITLPDGDRLVEEFELNATVRQLEALVKKRLSSHKSFEIHYHGEVLNSRSLLADSGVSNESCVQAVFKKVNKRMDIEQMLEDIKFGVALRPTVPIVKNNLPDFSQQDGS